MINKPGIINSDIIVTGNGYLSTLNTKPQIRHTLPGYASSPMLYALCILLFALCRHKTTQPINHYHGSITDHHHLSAYL